MRKVNVAVGLFVFFGGSRAQSDDLVAHRANLTLRGAKAVAMAAVAEAKKLRAPGGAIAVVDGGGTLLYLESLDGTFAAAGDISIGKARTSAKFRKPTSLFEDIIKKGRTPMVALDQFTPLQGGVPIMIDGQVAGAIGVSGAASAQQDEDIALAGARGLGMAGTTDGCSPQDVTFYGRSAVLDAFAKGIPLLDGGDGVNYKVHASRRDSPGQAEIHHSDTDIIYVREGDAIFVTGGEIVEQQLSAPEEVRGSAIANGVERKLTSGDVIVVPRGTPHWFREVSGTFTYFVVKVRECPEMTR